MGFKEDYINYSSRYLGEYVVQYEEYFSGVKDNIRKANIRMTLRQYLSVAVMSSIIGFVVLTPLVGIMFGLISGGIGGFIGGLIAGPFLGFGGAVGVFMFFYVYPSNRITKRRNNINFNLPFATTYLSTVAGMGTPVASIFKLLGQFDEYGEISNEARKIANDVYGFGADIEIALTRAAKRTPSEKFKDLLWGINSILTTGGDLKGFLREKANTYMEDYRRQLDKFSDTLSLLVEMYITVVIVGSVFIMIITTIMSSLGTDPMVILTMQIATVFLLLPISSLMFILIVKTVSPIENS